MRKKEMGKTKKSYNGIFIEKCFYNILLYDSKYPTCYESFLSMNQIIGRVKLKTFHNVKCVIPHQNTKIDKIKMCQSVGFAHQI